MLPAPYIFEKTSLTISSTRFEELAKPSRNSSTHSYLINLNPEGKRQHSSPCLSQSSTVRSETPAYEAAAFTFAQPFITLNPCRYPFSAFRLPPNIRFTGLVGSFPAHFWGGSIISSPVFLVLPVAIPFMNSMNGLRFFR